VSDSLDPTGIPSIPQGVHDLSTTRPILVPVALSSTTCSTARDIPPKDSATSIFSDSDIVDLHAPSVREAGRQVVTFSQSARGHAAAVASSQPSSAADSSVPLLGDLPVTPATARVVLLMHHLSSSQPNAVFLVSALLGALGADRCRTSLLDAVFCQV